MSATVWGSNTADMPNALVSRTLKQDVKRKSTKSRQQLNPVHLTWYQHLSLTSLGIMIYGGQHVKYCSGTGYKGSWNQESARLHLAGQRQAGCALPCALRHQLKPG